MIIEFIFLLQAINSDYNRVLESLEQEDKLTVEKGKLVRSIALLNRTVFMEEGAPKELSELYDKPV